MWRAVAGTVGCLLVAWGAQAGQAAAPAQAAAARPAPAAAEVWRPVYRFEIGDSVDFKFPFTPELDFSAPVRPDGAISFPYLGDVTLLGQTVSELSATLRAKYAGVLKSPEVTIIVRTFQPMRVFVAGEVPAPGRFEFRPGLTITQAVFGAGGFRDTANRKQIVLLRPASATALQVTLVSLGRRGAEAGDWPLLPNDIVLVPKSKISKLGQVIQQYSRDLLPVASLGLFFNLIGSGSASVVVGGAK